MSMISYAEIVNKINLEIVLVEYCKLRKRKIMCLILKRKEILLLKLGSNGKRVMRDLGSNPYKKIVP